MRRWLSPALVLGLAISTSGCAVRRIHDYIFEVTGVLSAEDGSPVKDAKITLEVAGPVYEAVISVKTVKQLTDSTGGFVFTYISHERGVKYSYGIQGWLRTPDRFGQLSSCRTAHDSPEEESRGSSVMKN